MNKGRATKLAGVTVFILLYFITRVPRIGTTIVNTDEVYWHDRSERFLNALKSKNFKETYQKYHPGVPLMWAFSISSEVISRTTGASTSEVFSYRNFEVIHTATQVFLSSWFLILSILLIYLLYKATDNWWASLLSVTVLSLEPFYLGNSRLIHHDVQISLCVLIGMVLVYLYSVKNWKFPSLIIASYFLSIGALSKTLFVGAFVFCLFAGSFFTIVSKGLKKLIVFISVLSIFFVLFYSTLFPAMLVSPKETINRIMAESYNVGEEDGHKQIFFGVETRDPGPSFYPILIGLKTTPFMILGIIFCLVFLLSDLYKGLANKEKIRFKNISLVLFISIFYFGYFSVITYFSKKVDRYIIPIYPFFALVCTYGWFRLVKLKKVLILLPVVLFVFTVLYPLYYLFPHYLMYTNPLIGDSKRSNEIIGQKLFGIGIFDLKDKIVSTYGDKMNVGINDYGPFLSIYPNAKVYNVLVEHPNSFKLMVLGPNKVFPIAILKDPNIKFEYVDSVFINGLEFWRIYRKAY